ncbi:MULTISPECIES: outer membrane beta-barrel protein [unclassified Ekhidna]|jgi:opacity protein-like surface antigen|uniref:outer membrane beta-barrel protein n=1 Tax=unclassified Ekhidna TaxID=2632188 RepID=UPI0032DF6BA3
MKKFTILSLFAAFLLVGMTANAQEQGDIRVGAGLAIGTKAGVDESGEKMGFGLNFGAEYLVTDVISIAPSYTMFFKSSVGGGDYSLSALNIDARYYFGESGVYGLAGFSSVSAKVEGGGFSATTSEGGLNIGAGIMYPLSDNLFANGQVKYQTPGEGQLVINAGIAFAF